MGSLDRGDSRGDDAVLWAAGMCEASASLVPKWWVGRPWLIRARSPMLVREPPRIPAFVDDLGCGGEEGALGLPPPFHLRPSCSIGADSLVTGQN